MRCLFVLLGLIAHPAIAGSHPVGEAHRIIPLASAAARRADHKPELDVTIWYPAASGTREAPVVIGPPANPYFRVAMAAQDAKPAASKRPVILMSHGFGGTAEMMGWLGAALARAGYIVVSVDHPGNHDGDMTAVGSIAWWERPRDMIAALNAIREDSVFKPLIDGTRVGAAGFSIGGMTALALAGAKIDPGNYDRFCAAHPTDGVCQPPAETKNPSSISRAEGAVLLGLADAQAHAGDATALPGLKAVLSIAPPAQQLAQDSFAAIHVPVTIVFGDADTVVPPEYHAVLAARAIARSRLVEVQGAAHYSFLSDCTRAARGHGGACDAAPNQTAAHKVAIVEGLALFHRSLGRPD